jgi:hypothetical protein
MILSRFILAGTAGASVDLEFAAPGAVPPPIPAPPVPASPVLVPPVPLPVSVPVLIGVVSGAAVGDSEAALMGGEMPKADPLSTTIRESN